MSDEAVMDTIGKLIFRDDEYLSPMECDIRYMGLLIGSGMEEGAEETEDHWWLYVKATDHEKPGMAATMTWNEKQMLLRDMRRILRVKFGDAYMATGVQP